MPFQAAYWGALGCNTQHDLLAQPSCGVPFFSKNPQKKEICLSQNILFLFFILLMQNADHNCRGTSLQYAPQKESHFGTPRLGLLGDFDRRSSDFAANTPRVCRCKFACGHPPPRDQRSAREQQCRKTSVFARVPFSTRTTTILWGFLL